MTIPNHEPAGKRDDGAFVAHEKDHRRKRLAMHTLGKTLANRSRFFEFWDIVNKEMRRRMREGELEDEARYEAVRVVAESWFRDGDLGEADDPAAIQSAADVPTLQDAFEAGATKRWLWNGWLLADALNGLVGKFGDGKTRFLMDLIRRICHGDVWPDGQRIIPQPDLQTVAPGPDSKFLFVPLDYQQAELIDLADQYGIPREQVFLNAPDGSADGLSPIDTAEGLAALERRVNVLRPALVIIDPITAASAERNQGRAEDVTALYGPFQKIARKYGTTFLVLIHTNAAGGTYGRHATGKFRVEIKLTKVGDDDGARYRLEVTKSNSKKPEPLGASQFDDGWRFNGDPPEADGVAVVGKRGPRPRRLDEAVQFLRQELEQGERLQTELIDRWVDGKRSKNFIFDAARLLEERGELLADERESPRGRTMLKTWVLKRGTGQAEAGQGQNGQTEDF
jgi:hypothetical protein